MEGAGVLRRILSLEPAEPAALEAEIREEIEFHLATAAREGEEAGLAPEDARRDAERRFGSVEKAVRGCLAARTGGRVMLQRVNLALVALLIGAVAFLGWSLHASQARTSAELGDVREGMDRLVRAVGSDGEEDGPGIVDRVHVLGRVKQPGPVGGRDLTLCKAISLARGFDQHAATGKIRVLRMEGGQKSIEEIDFQRILDGEVDDPALRPGDLVFVPEAIF